MNNRLKELVISAQLSYILTPDKPYIEADLQKLAELILNECATQRSLLTQFSGNTEYGDGYENGLRDMAETILELFQNDSPTTSPSQ